MKLYAVINPKGKHHFQVYPGVEGRKASISLVTHTRMEATATV
jgi:hypothetical protein